MESLSNSSSRVLSDNLRAAAAPSRNHHPRELRFLASWSPSRRGGLNLGVSRSISLHHSTRVHAISGSSQEFLQSEEAETGDATKTVQVKFLLQKECAFGEQFHLVGDDPILGLWDPLSAIPLDWSEGNVWTLELDLPVGKSFQFKFILKGIAEDILWQPGPDRILHTWETKDTIWVSEDWENAELQVISDKEPTPSEKLIIGETITEPVKELEEANEDKASYAKRNIDEFDETVSVLNKDADTGDKTLAVNGGAVTSKAFAGTKEGVTLVTYEGEPVLVPGLTVVDAEETFSSETDKATVGNGSSGVEMAKEQNVAELELETEPADTSSSHTKASTTVMMLSDDDEESLPQSKEQVVEDKKMMQLATTTVQGQPNSKPFQNNVLEKDMQWGRKTLQKLLANFGSLLHQMD